ncbi:MAG: hypothetical protein NTW59_03955 [Candidatus Diapherotrites archaeon]|nr:hypothetical protein [Candidatus Diapherotrites archaeon]
MQLYENIFGVRFSHRSFLMLGFLALFPNILGMIVLQTPFGFKFHFFQIAIFLAALLYGKWGGALSGAAGSVYTAIAFGNPFVIGGNVILGFFAGAFARKENFLVAAMAAFAIQLPWLYFTDLLAGMPEPTVRGVMVALFFSNIVWAGLAGLVFKRIRPIIQ